MRARAALLIVALAPTGAWAQTCEADVGAELAAVYVEQCIEVSPATRPPCNAENSCELILDEVARGCAGLAVDMPEQVPDSCAEHLQSQ